jgi:hypothetical protein
MMCDAAFSSGYASGRTSVFNREETPEIQSARRWSVVKIRQQKKAL